MKIPPSRLLLCLGIFLFYSPLQVQAKHKHEHHHGKGHVSVVIRESVENHQSWPWPTVVSQPRPVRLPKPPPLPAPLATPAPEPASLPAEVTPRISHDAPPSASLQPFLDAHLDKILVPLGVPAFAQPEVIAGLKAGYADGMAAAPEAHKPAFQLAQSVCDAMAGAITERQNAVAALRGALAARSSEAAQPRGGGEAVEKARESDAFFIDSQKTAWLQRATALRQGITTLYLRERAIERQIGAWPPPPAPAPPAPSGAPPEGSDPVIGQWMLKGTTPLMLGADHSITGGRHGSWLYTCTTNAGRNYELHWNPPKDWVDYLVLSSDGKVLDGKTRHDESIAAYRQ